VEPRLQNRYRQLILEHLHVAGQLHSGLSALPGLNDSFASVQAAWRFYANERITLPVLADPLLEAAQRWRQRAEATIGLVVHDWSSLKYPGHKSKTDRTQLGGNEHGHGYELSTALLVDGSNGDPIAPLEMRLVTAETVYSTRTPVPSPDAYRIDQVLPTLQAVAGLNLGPLVHIIDREADWLDHYRQWHGAGYQFVVRADGERKVRWEGQEIAVADLNHRLHQRGVFQRSREVLYKGERAIQYVAETTVVLDRPAWRCRKRGGKTVKKRIPGPPLTLRLVISRVCNVRGETVAVWYLLTNVSALIAAMQVALWYYWRWRIESYFKLLKSGGQQLEHWLQESGEAIAKRLLVASMACVLVWQLERDTSAPAATLRELLVKLSGRQMKHGREYTASALLAGLQVFLSMMAILDHHSLEELRALREAFLSEQDTG
jgi:hypothetical protein